MIYLEYAILAILVLPFFAIFVFVVVAGFVTLWWNCCLLIRHVVVGYYKDVKEKLK